MGHGLHGSLTLQRASFHCCDDRSGPGACRAVRRRPSDNEPSFFLEAPGKGALRLLRLSIRRQRISSEITDSMGIFGDDLKKRLWFKDPAGSSNFDLLITGVAGPSPAVLTNDFSYLAENPVRAVLSLSANACRTVRAFRHAGSAIEL